MFTDSYCNEIFNKKNSPQFTDEIFISTYLFVFVNFLVIFDKPKLTSQVD